MIETMTLDMMQAYRGRHEVPTDFDSFWQEQLNSLPDLPDYQLIEKPVGLAGMNCSELWFTGNNG
ncbi:TPA: acetylxylan esterase, partial [Streptococcus suis]